VLRALLRDSGGKVVRDRGGDGDGKDNIDWWKVAEARIIRRLQASYSAWYHS